MLEYMPYLWVAIIVLSVIVEAMTAGLVAIWFVPAAIVSIILAFCRVPIWIQVMVWLIISIVCVSSTRTVFKKIFMPKTKKTNIDLIIGEHAVVTERINNISGSGQVKVKGQYWTARAADESRSFEEGAVVTIIAIEGVKLICK